jgi:alanine racemase
MLYKTHVMVDLNNIRHNIEGVRQRVGPHVKVLIAVKGDAYGHGSVEVSRLAEEMGLDWVGVATLPEALKLREAGIRMPILKMSHLFEDQIEPAIEHDITFAITTIERAQAANAVARRMNRQARVHMKVDTGMGRIGVGVGEAWKLADEILHGCSSLVLEGIFTHLPVSDESSKLYTQRQVERFKKCVEDIEAKMQYSFPLVHCANSGGVLAHEDSWFNMVRPGIMIYGYYPSDEVEQTVKLKPAFTFQSKVSFLKKVAKGTSIGYGRAFIAPEDTWIATFPAGYADGFNRLFSNKGRVLINGQSYPVVGKVCMDQSMCNLGPRTDIKIGDDVVLIGKSNGAEITVDEWAKKLDTISYEIICQINKRTNRYYIKD